MTTPTCPCFFSPAGARTCDSIALLWDPPPGRGPGTRYEVFCGGKSAGSVGHCDFTLDGLLPDTAYAFAVRAMDAAGNVSASYGPIEVRTRRRGPVLDVASFGARGDGAALDTMAIQSAIDACEPDGTVLVPPGVFRTGALFLKSDMTLRIVKGATLLGSADPSDYPLVWDRAGDEVQIHASLINAGELRGGAIRNVVVTGGGRVDGNGAALAPRERGAGAGRDMRGKVICFRNARDAYIEGVTVLQSPGWCVHLIYCEGVSVNRVRVFTDADEEGRRYEGIENGDGVNPDSSRDVCIFNCDISSQDDCVAIKSGRDAEGRRIGRPSENIRVTNCRFLSGFGVAVGSEMSGGVRNVLVEDCLFEDVAQLLQVKTPRGRGGVVENVVVRDATHRNRRYDDCRWFRGGICLDAFYGEASPVTDVPAAVGEGTPTVRNITVENVRLSSPRGRAILLCGLPERPYRDIRLTNVTAEAMTGLLGENVENVRLENVRVSAGGGPALEWRRATGVSAV